MPMASYGQQPQQLQQQQQYKQRLMRRRRRKRTDNRQQTDKTVNQLNDAFLSDHKESGYNMYGIKFAT